MTEETALQKVKFYQTGTHTVGNRLMDEDARSVQASTERSNAITSGHRACQGCGEALGARYALDAAMRASNCGSVSSVRCPWRLVTAVSCFDTSVRPASMAA